MMHGDKRTEFWFPINKILDPLSNGLMVKCFNICYEIHKVTASILMVVFFLFSSNEIDKTED